MQCSTRGSEVSEKTAVFQDRSQHPYIADEPLASCFAVFVFQCAKIAQARIYPLLTHFHPYQALHSPPNAAIVGITSRLYSFRCKHMTVRVNGAMMH